MASKKYTSSNYFNYKEKPIPNILNLKDGSYIYIIQNQKSITKLIISFISNAPSIFSKIAHVVIAE